jgi:hypothetical protein
MKIYIITACPYWAEYSSQKSVLDVGFTTEDGAKEHIERLKESEIRLIGNPNHVSDYSIEEIEIVN